MSGAEATAAADSPDKEKAVEFERIDGKMHVKMKTGNRYVMVEPTFLTSLDAVEVCGDMGGNSKYVEMAYWLMTLVEMNGEKVLRPTTKAELRDLAKRIPPIDASLLSIVLYSSSSGGVDRSAAKN